jgi:hypothetical protein
VSVQAAEPQGGTREEAYLIRAFDAPGSAVLAFQKGIDRNGEE